MKNRLILVDANIWIAKHNTTDSTHQQGVQLVSDLEQSGSQLLITNGIVQEVFTVLTYKKNLAAARLFHKKITANKKIYSLDLDKQWEPEIMRFIDALPRAPKMSFVDYSLLLVARVFGAELLTFDEQLLKFHQQLGNNNKSLYGRSIKKSKRQSGSPDHTDNPILP